MATVTATLSLKLFFYAGLDARNGCYNRATVIAKSSFFQRNKYIKLKQARGGPHQQFRNLVNFGQLRRSEGLHHTGFTVLWPCWEARAPFSSVKGVIGGICTPPSPWRPGVPAA